MGATQYYCAATLDGFIAEADDTLDWLLKYEGSFDGPEAEPMKGSYDRFYDDVGAVVMGSATYQFVLDEVSSWPYAGKPAWVLTSRELSLPETEGADIRFANAAVAELSGDGRGGRRSPSLGHRGRQRGFAVRRRGPDRRAAGDGGAGRARRGQAAVRPPAGGPASCSSSRAAASTPGWSSCATRSCGRPVPSTSSSRYPRTTRRLASRGRLIRARSRAGRRTSRRGGRRA